PISLRDWVRPGVPLISCVRRACGRIQMNECALSVACTKCDFKNRFRLTLPCVKCGAKREPASEPPMPQRVIGLVLSGMAGLTGVTAGTSPTRLTERFPLPMHACTVYV